MRSMGNALTHLQNEMRSLEAAHQLAGLEPIALASIQEPLFQNLHQTFDNLSEQERNAIISKLDDFVTAEVQQRLNEARDAVTDIAGRGTTIKQDDQISYFYGEIRRLLKQALRDHLKQRIGEFAAAIQKNAESVNPRIREASEGLIQQRLKAIESTLQIAADGQKEHVHEYLENMIALYADFVSNTVLKPDLG